jgi:hypothetical protein
MENLCREGWDWRRLRVGNMVWSRFGSFGGWESLTLLLKSRWLPDGFIDFTRVCMRWGTPTSR